MNVHKVTPGDLELPQRYFTNMPAAWAVRNRVGLQYNINKIKEHELLRDEY